MQAYFTFQRPEWLWMLLAAPALLLLTAAYLRWKRGAMAQLGAVERNMSLVGAGRLWLRAVLLAVAVALLAVAVANPQKGMKMNASTQRSADIFIALDISQSMLAEDVKPSRLILAKAFAQKLVKTLAGERLGLIFFAGKAFVQSPLSDDHNFLLKALGDATPELISTQGTAFPEAIALTQKTIDDGSGVGGKRALILISDGENHGEDASEAASEAFADGLVIYPVGVGTNKGGPIPLGNEGLFKRDEQDQVVITKADFEGLQRIAAAGGGRAFPLRQSDATLQNLKKEVENLDKRDIQLRSHSEMESWYQWFLLPALLLLCWEMWGLKWPLKMRK